MVQLIERVCKVVGAAVLFAGVGFSYLWFADPFKMKSDYEAMVGAVASVASKTSAELQQAVRPKKELEMPGVGRVLEGVRDGSEKLFDATSQ